MIENKMIEKEQWKSVALSTTVSMGGERVRSSGSQQKMADAVDRYIDIEQEINRRIDAMYDAKCEIIEVIEQLNAIEYDLLHKVYVQDLTLTEVAADYDKTYSWATTVHGRALQHVQRILDKREEKDAK
jgi:DNA-directed RNA polymerase specialized sigma subunit